MAKEPSPDSQRSLAEEALLLSKQHRTRVDEILAVMDEKDRQDLLAILADDRYTTAAIAAVLRRRGHRIGETSVRRYRATMSK